MKINGDYIKEYRSILQTTNLQKGYQEFVKFFRYLKTYLEKEMQEYTFTNNIVENNMDYSYFQFTNQELKSSGLKIVIAFVHRDFDYEVWLSGINRKIQNNYYGHLKSKPQKYTLTDNPNRTDYILKTKIIENCNYDDLEQLLFQMKINIADFIKNNYLF